VLPDRHPSESPPKVGGGAKNGRQDVGVIVIVDDDADTRGAIRTLLEDQGYRTAEASDGQEALAMVQQPRFKAALLLLDLMMPTMDGWQLRARLRADPDLATIPIVIMTAHSAMLRALVNAEPQTLVMRKPLDFDRLLEIVATYCP
jgi:CheY-like chemotaxis protein